VLLMASVVWLLASAGLGLLLGAMVALANRDPLMAVEAADGAGATLKQDAAPIVA
jgi:hypothetical protein